jgi:hypothetical protein
MRGIRAIPSIKLPVVILQASALWLVDDDNDAFVKSVLS